MKLTKPIILATLALLIVFLLDLFTPLGIAIGVLYLFCFLLVRRENKQLIIMFAIIASVLTITKLFIFLSLFTAYSVYLNRGISIIVIWITTILAIRHQTLAEMINSERGTQIKELKKTILSISNYKILFEQIPLSVMFLGYEESRKDFVIRDVNTSACEIEKTSKKIIKNKTILEFYPHPKNTEILNLLKDVYETGNSIVSTSWLFKEGESEEWRELSMFKLLNNEIVVAFKDVSKTVITEQALKKSVSENKILLNEVHHRVKNNLQIIIGLLQMQGNAFKDEPFINEFLLQSENRVKAMDLIHETIYKTGRYSGIDIVAYIRSLFNYLCNVIGNPQIKFNIETEIKELSISNASAFGIIFNEIISNSLKHSFPNNSNGKISVSIIENRDETILITIRDNGVGVRSINENSKGLGVELIFGLIKQINGEVEMETFPSFKYSIVIPTKKNIQNSSL